MEFEKSPDNISANETLTQHKNLNTLAGKVLPKDLIPRAEFLLNSPGGVSSNDWHDKFHAPSARNTPSDLRREYGIGIEKMPMCRTVNGKRYWPQRVINPYEAAKLFGLIQVSRIAHGLSPLTNEPEIISRFV